MMKSLHSLPGLVLALGLTLTAVTGAALSVAPVVDRLAAPEISRGNDVASLVATVTARHDSVSAIKVRPSGVVTAAFTDGDTSGVERIDPATGASLGPFEVSPLVRTLTDLHRAFGLGAEGRIAAAVAAAAMLLLAVTGGVLLARRLGGARALLRPVTGTATARLHGEVARIAVAGLVVSSLTGLWMSASTFGLLPEPAALETVAGRGGAALPLARLSVLGGTAVADLRELTLPDPTTVGEPILLKTASGETAIDPATGAVLARVEAGPLDRIDAIVRMLHTGRGAALFGLLLGLSAAAVPLLGATGWAMRLARRLPTVSPVATVSARDADTVILVGTDGGSTRGFTNTLARALVATGHTVHVADMNAVSEDHLAADRVLILAATFGDGGAPASADRFLDRIARLDGRPPVAVLGFGDRTFTDFCGYAREVAATLARARFPFLIETKRIDRRSAQEFGSWGHELGAALGHDLVLEHVAERPKTTALELVEREDYGAAVGAPVAILRFAAPLDATRGRPGRLPLFEAGDLLGVVLDGVAVPRFYSLASSAADGIVEICVRLMPGGVVSSVLHALSPGDRIDAFVRENPTFRPDRAAASWILIGAGAGLGPLAGFLRASDGSRPIHLYWGGRNPASDFLYEEELAHALADKRLTSLVTAFSRDPRSGVYVQDRIADDEQALRERIRHGAQILVCGSRDMGRAVAITLDRIVRPLGLDLATLRAGGRYVEDIY